MKFSVQIEDFTMLKEATRSDCDRIRFGSEFCEYKLPSMDELAKFLKKAEAEEKHFSYVTPRLSNKGIEKIKKQLVFLNEKKDIDVVFNDLGLLNLLGQHSNLNPHLGRQLIRVPARSPWVDDYLNLSVSESKKKLSEAYSSTSLHHPSTIQFFKARGVKKVDLDWIPRTFPGFSLLKNHGLNLSVHLHLVPITVTRRCHMARLIGENAPENCSKPCLETALLLKYDEYGLRMFLNGNAVFNLENPVETDMKSLEEVGVNEIVLTSNPITEIDTRQKINGLITTLKEYCE